MTEPDGTKPDDFSGFSGTADSPATSPGPAPASAGTSAPSARPGSPEAGVADALGQLTDQTTLLVRREVDMARRELLDKLRLDAPGMALLLLAGGCTIFSLASAYRFTLRVLERRLSPASAAFLATLGYGAAAAAAGVAGYEAMKAAPAPIPTDTAQHAAGVVSDVSKQAGR